MKKSLCAALTFFAAPVSSQTDFTALSDGELRLFREEVRAVLLAHPEIVESALTPQPYADEINSDLALIRLHGPTLFAGHDIALFVSSDCAVCARAEKELSALAQAQGLSINVLIVERHAGLQAALEIDSLPFYVLPDKMLRGMMPATVLQRFLSGL